MVISMPKRCIVLALKVLVVLLGIWFCVLAILAITAPEPVSHKPRHDGNKSDHATAATNPVAYDYADGTQKLFPGNRIVALYGSPGAPRLGALGEQSLEQAIARAKQLASDYQLYSSEHMMPALEIITTVASSSPTANNDYSNELDASALQPWVEAAKAAGVYVVLDLQPGRTDFLSQAKLYEYLLREPNVGLALDPEWRLGANQVPLQQIGSVDVSEINATSTWLADITKQVKLPQKLFLVHQFRNSMIGNRALMDTSHPELAYVIQMDGNGAQSTKQSTWSAIRQNPPANVLFGWKNFYDEDLPVLSPEATMALNPKPWYVSYQ